MRERLEKYSRCFAAGVSGSDDRRVLAVRQFLAGS
jgi:hypothetical protein